MHPRRVHHEAAAVSSRLISLHVLGQEMLAGACGHCYPVLMSDCSSSNGRIWTDAPNDPAVTSRCATRLTV